jgi:3D (Asp-Asp-Asp) domain-containing protein
VGVDLHIGGKLSVIGLVITALITAFSLPQPSDAIPLAVAPSVHLLTTPRSVSEALVLGPIANPVFTLRATGYNSLASQTDSTPHITATGQRTEFGIVAVSRDLLGRDLPYGSLVRIRDLGNYYNGRGAGQHQTLLDSQGLFIVEDTMHIRKIQQIDVWFGDYASAVNWGVRQVEVELVRYGRHGPTLLSGEGPFEATPQLVAAR